MVSPRTGLIGTHLLPHAVEHGFSEVTAASAIGLMGMMNVVGTLASGWLTDRYDNRRLLAFYYTFRAISIAFLPVILAVPWFFVFAIVYGLDWIATVPPTVNLTSRLYGRAHMGTIYGWIFCSHMIGAALAAFLGGAVHDALGDYTSIFLAASLLGFVAAGLAMRISVPGRPDRLQRPSRRRLGTCRSPRLAQPLPTAGSGGGRRARWPVARPGVACTTGTSARRRRSGNGPAKPRAASLRC